MTYQLKETLLYLENVNFGYGNPKDKEFKIVLKDINIIEKDVIRDENTTSSTGQVIAVLGKSGRGKSTLFKILTGLVKPTSGRALIRDLKSTIENSAKTIEEGDIGFVNQKYTLFRHKTVNQILLYALRKQKISKVEKQKIVDEYLLEWGLSQQKEKYQNEMSGGQRQRTAIIEQILCSGHFMVLDEPASGLDVGNIEKFKQSLNKISSDDELNTTIFSTHDIHLAVELADSIYILGFPEGTTEYSTIIKHYDLKEMGIAWTEFGSKHLQLVNDIKEIILKS